MKRFLSVPNQSRKKSARTPEAVRRRRFGGGSPARELSGFIPSRIPMADDFCLTEAESHAEMQSLVDEYLGQIESTYTKILCPRCRIILMPVQWLVHPCCHVVLHTCPWCFGEKTFPEDDSVEDRVLHLFSCFILFVKRHSIPPSDQPLWGSTFSNECDRDQAYWMQRYTACSPVMSFYHVLIRLDRWGRFRQNLLQLQTTVAPLPFSCLCDGREEGAASVLHIHLLIATLQTPLQLEATLLTPHRGCWRRPLDSGDQFALAMDFISKPGTPCCGSG